LLTITVFAPPEQIGGSEPRGFAMVDDIFHEAKLSDPVSNSQKHFTQLERTLGYLVRRYPKRINVQWINPWSAQGLIFAFRYRLRIFPTVLLQSHSEQKILASEELASLSDHVARLLSKPADK
jgi:hypothetical protein